jgi:hypothetical protein
MTQLPSHPVSVLFNNFFLLLSSLSASSPPLLLSCVADDRGRWRRKRLIKLKNVIATSPPPLNLI